MDSPAQTTSPAEPATNHEPGDRMVKFEEEIRRLGVKGGIFPNLTVDDNLRMATFAGAAFADIRERTYVQFPQLRLRQKQLAGTLTGGEQQMLALARSLSVDPAVLIIDELSMGLAPIVVEQLYAIVAELAARRAMAIVIVEQFAHDVLNVATRAAIMGHGRLIAIAQPHQIAARLSDTYLARAR